VIGFKPTQAGAKMTLLIINSNDPDERVFSVMLNGNVSAPDIEVTPTSLDFGNATVGSLVTRALVVRNLGTSPLIISMLGLDGSLLQFSFRGSTPAVLAPGQSANIPLGFHPSAAGAKTAVCVISSNDPDEGTVEIPMRGNGVTSQ
jgi:hypothetical protein